MIEWKLHLTSPPERVYEFLATAEGRASFWADSAPERNGVIEFTFPDGSHWRARVTVAEPPTRFGVTYFGETDILFMLADDGAGGCDLTLTDTADDEETRAGWVSVLLALKAAAAFQVDLRNHDATRTWRQGFADN